MFSAPSLGHVRPRKGPFLLWFPKKIAREVQVIRLLAEITFKALFFVNRHLTIQTIVFTFSPFAPSSPGTPF